MITLKDWCRMAGLPWPMPRPGTKEARELTDRLVPITKKYKFEMGGSYTYYLGKTVGEALECFIFHRANRVKDITAIIEEPIEDYERP